MTNTTEGHGTELEIANVDETDAGDYECTAVNAGSEPVTEKITLIVNCKYNLIQFNLRIEHPLPHQNCVKGM